jgi:hypothetical protein
MDRFRKAAEDALADRERDFARRLKESTGEVDALKTRLDGMVKSVDGAFSKIDNMKKTHEK